MSKLRVACFAISTDGFGAGPDQSLDHPLGIGGEALHRWFFPTATFRKSVGKEGGSTGLDDRMAAAGTEGVGAWILGRNMFGPIRGPWPDDSWKGWWGDEPPYHTPVFVLTHHPRDPVEMEGGTTFHFVTEGIHAALERAREAAGGLDVRLGGGVATIRQYLTAGLVDDMHLVLSPAILGSGENLLGGIDLRALGFAVTRHAASEQAMHVVLEKERVDPLPPNKDSHKSFRDRHESRGASHMTSNEAPNTEFPRSIGKVAARELARSGYTRFEDLTRVSKRSLLEIHGVGPKSLNILEEELEKRGLGYKGS